MFELLEVKPKKKPTRRQLKLINDLYDLSKPLYEDEYYRAIGYVHEKAQEVYADDEHFIRVIRGANRSGKSFTCGKLVAMYITDRYFYQGRKRKKIGGNKLVWVFSNTRGTQLETVQKPIMRYLEEDELTDIAYESRALGTIQAFTVKATGTRVEFKTYDQGRERAQGAAVDLIWMDEECSDESLFSELVMRRGAGRELKMILSFTPLLGRSWSYYKFHMNPDRDNVKVWNFTWDDNPFLTRREKDEPRRRTTDRRSTQCHMGNHARSVSMFGRAHRSNRRQGHEAMTPERDIVERLETTAVYRDMDEVMREAAAEIRRLREEIARLRADKE